MTKKTTKKPNTKPQKQTLKEHKRSDSDKNIKRGTGPRVKQ